MSAVRCFVMLLKTSFKQGFNSTPLRLFFVELLSFLGIYRNLLDSYGLLLGCGQSILKRYNQLEGNQ